MTAAVYCPKCQAASLPEVWNEPNETPCPVCQTQVRVYTFPALSRPVARGQNAEPVVMEGEASCFYHPQKRASVPCHACGRFLCVLCDCEFQGNHYCPACLQTGKTKGKIKNLQNQRVLYDSIALALVILPMVILVGIYFTFITAPLTIFIAIRYWKAPLSIVRHSRWRFVVATILALGQLVGWAFAIYKLSTSNAFNG